MIHRNSIKFSLFFLVVFVFSLSVGVSGQTIISRNKNNPYSPSPVGKVNIAQRTLSEAKNHKSRTIQPTDIYKIGVGDVLLVNLKYSAQGSSYCTVRPDGTLDFPLAGDNLIVADQTVDEIEQFLASGIILFPEAQVEVKIHEYASHRITVSGMVENPGEKSLQREALPLFVISAESVVKPTATKVVIKRAPLSKQETYDLDDTVTDNILIYPGNSVEFTD